MKLNRDGTVAVDENYFWKRIDKDTPIGMKLQLINRRSGVAQYSVLQKDNTWYTHYQVLPSFKKDEE